MATGCVWLLVLGFVVLCNLVKTLLPSISSHLAKVFQNDADCEAEMRAAVQDMRKQLSAISMMDEFARYARLERKISKTTDRLKTYGEKLRGATGRQVSPGRLSLSLLNIKASDECFLDTTTRTRFAPKNIANGNFL
uniref:Guided entry of tail-anchored proteins factor 1 n=1 Tax=Denticeps clupeoides TaxID=299321 RepID=A0AAY4AJB3_9TELE